MSNKPETTIRTKNTVLQVAEPFNEVEQKILKASEKCVTFITLHSTDDNVPIMINIHTITLVYPDTEETREHHPLERILP
jgi:hypothetical protein